MYSWGCTASFSPLITSCTASIGCLSMSVVGVAAKIAAVCSNFMGLKPPFWPHTCHSSVPEFYWRCLALHWVKVKLGGDVVEASLNTGVYQHS